MMKKAGDILRAARNAKNLTIEDIFEGTRIRPSYIEALERSDYSQFHSSTTIKGFIKNYALYLGLNPENVIAVYRREQNLKIEENQKKMKFSLPRFQISPSIFVIGGAILIVTSIIGFFTYQYIQVSRPPIVEIIRPADLSSTTDDKITVEVATEKSTDIQINNKPISTLNDNGNFFTTVDLVDGQNSIIVTATNGYKKQTTKEIKVFRAKPNDVIANKDLNISLKSVTTNPIELKYTLDQDSQVTKKFNPGEIISIIAKDKIDFSGPANMNNLFELSINQSRVSLLANTPKQEIKYVDGQLKISALP